MFCKNCGSEMRDTASFCNNCGTPVGQINTLALEKENLKEEDNVVRIEIRPTFIWIYQFLTKIESTMIILCIPCLMSLGFTTFSYFPYMLGWFAGINVLVCFIRVLLSKAQYKRTSYKFLKTKVEYTDSFLNKEEKQLKYEHIREVTMSQSILDRMFKIGSICLHSNAVGGYSGVHIHYVTNVQERLKEIKQIIDEATE